MAHAPTPELGVQQIFPRPWPYGQARGLGLLALAGVADDRAERRQGRACRLRPRRHGAPQVWRWAGRELSTLPRSLTCSGVSQQQQQLIYCVTQAHITRSTPGTIVSDSADELARSAIVRIDPNTQSSSQGHLDEVIRTAIENCWGAILVNSLRCKFQDACVLAPLCKSSGGCVTSSAEPAVLALAERPACHSAPSETATELDAAFDLVRSALHKSARVGTVPRPRDRLKRARGAAEPTSLSRYRCVIRHLERCVASPWESRPPHPALLTLSPPLPMLTTNRS